MLQKVAAWKKVATAAFLALGFTKRISQDKAHRTKGAASAPLSSTKRHGRSRSIPPGLMKGTLSRSSSSVDSGFNAWWINDDIDLHAFPVDSVIDLPQLRAYLAAGPVAITLGDLSDTLDIGLEAKALADVLKRDSRFMLVSGQEESCSVLLPKAALFRWFVGLNLRLAAIGQFKLSEKHVAHCLNNRLLPVGDWSEPPPQVISWGAGLHLIRPSSVDNCYLFPLARVLSCLSLDILSVAINVLGEFAEMRVWDIALEKMRDQSIEEVFAVFPERVVDVVRLREGLFEDNTARLTLEQVGRKIGLTRERIRQLERQFYASISLEKVVEVVRLKRVLFEWKLRRDGVDIQRAGHIDRLKEDISESKLRRQLSTCLITAFLCEVLAFGDIVSDFRSLKGNYRWFLARCFGVPVAANDNWQIIGMEPDRFRSMLRGTHGKPRKTLNEIARGIARVTAELEKEGISGEISKDIRAKWYRQLAKTEKVRLALIEIGEPAHFRDITEVYNAMWPDDYSSEGTIHGTLDRATNGIVWVGVRGTYALREWGYEQADVGLFQLASQTVRSKYRETGKPVPFMVIAAEIGKHRKLITPSSLQFAVGLNPKLRRVGKDTFAPVEEYTDLEEQDSADIQWEKALEEFENEALS